MAQTPVYPAKGYYASKADAEYAALHPSATKNASDPTKVTASSASGGASSSSVVSVNVEAPDLTGLSQVGQGVENAQAGFNHFRDVLKETFAVPNLIDFFGGAVGVWVILGALTLLALETEPGQAITKGATKAASLAITKGVL